jgi:deaminated glutathione amidase
MMSDNRPKVAAIQMASSPSVSANLLEAEKLVGEAAAAGARLVVLPENFAFMGRRDAELLEHREPDGGGRLQSFLAQLAVRHGLWLVGGTIPLETARPDRVRAACLVFDDQGQRVGRYDKMHLFDVSVPDSDERYAESETIEPGSEAVVLDTPFGRLGLAICYDLRFPELFRQLSALGAEVVALPAAFTAITGRAHWEPLVRARAIENLCYLVAAAQGGYHLNGRETHGHSLIVNPWGTVLGELARGAGAVVQELDLAYLASTRLSFPSLSHRRIPCGADIN